MYIIMEMLFIITIYGIYRIYTYMEKNNIQLHYQKEYYLIKYLIKHQKEVLFTYNICPA